MTHPFVGWIWILHSTRPRPHHATTTDQVVEASFMLTSSGPRRLSKRVNKRRLTVYQNLSPSPRVSRSLDYCVGSPQKGGGLGRNAFSVYCVPYCFTFLLKFGQHQYYVDLVRLAIVCFSPVVYPFMVCSLVFGSFSNQPIYSLFSLRGRRDASR